MVNVEGDIDGEKIDVGGPCIVEVFNKTNGELRGSFNLNGIVVAGLEGVGKSN